ncbi:CoA pyrophosphatase [Marinospirillum alkaliphilum]|uniref:8-oxo-dGTP pyrophosphatase MutT, NUDIX family n=1 Tax=Marinospirillum alkaliphilum DSM 21637 TaxID=1122209 RepID=A0A1K1VW48_9GAMM|nr:CoA pyrophosphatase [Marinospirillum alkaliphilum]SFX29239.1 8-oxo-dGTP pyrophosphatase MutT, NUDIX family [Marinospirillum alkaliphilum DSM 21637]
MLNQLATALKNFQPQRLHWKLPEAAVLIPVTDGAEPSIIMTRRADHLNTHSGQVAFPGGKRDPEDANLAATALREAQEETGLQPDQVQLLGPLSDLVSLHGIKVTPWVGLVPESIELQPCEAELDAIFRVPVRWLLEDPRSHTDVIQVADTTFYVPSYPFGEFTIWGLSSMMLVELLRVGFNMDIDLHQQPSGRLVQRPVRPFPPR